MIPNTITATCHDFSKERISTRVLVDANNKTYHNYVKNQVEIEFSAYFYKGMEQYKELEYTFEKPTFLEWLLRKPRKVKVTINSFDVLLDPPAFKDKTLRMYNYNIGAVEIK